MSLRNNFEKMPQVSSNGLTVGDDGLPIAGDQLNPLPPLPSHVLRAMSSGFFAPVGGQKGVKGDPRPDEPTLNKGTKC